MKGVVLWANPDRHPLAGATNTNVARMPVLMGDVKAKEERLTTFLCDPPLLRAYGACGALRPRLCEIQKSHRWRLSLLCHCSVLRCLVTVVTEVIRLVNPSCGFFRALTKQRFRMTYASACQDQTYAYRGGRLACPLSACPRLLLLLALSRACHPIFPQRVCPRPVSRFQFFS